MLVALGIDIKHLENSHGNAASDSAGNGDGHQQLNQGKAPLVFIYQA